MSLFSRYDGWEQSLESAAANIAQGEGELRRRNRSLGTVPSGAATLRRREQLREGFKSVNTFVQPSANSLQEYMSIHLHHLSQDFLQKNALETLEGKTYIP